MNSKFFLLVFFLQLSGLSLLAQVSLEDGFVMLESQEYLKASEFFNNILEEYPQNKTARICYGRAVGLGGDTELGLKIFKSLSVDHPQDYEVELNVAEAYMWQKEFDKAYIVYQKLLEIDSNNYVANLGFANANASMNENTVALRYINKAISISSENQGAKISKKYILLALADKARHAWNYEEAHKNLDEVFELYSNDSDAILVRAVVYLSEQHLDEALECYKTLAYKEPTKIEALIGLSYTYLLQNNAKKSLMYAKQATALANTLEVDEKLYLRSAINEVNALAFSRKYQDASSLLSRLESNYPDAIEVKLAQARIKVWSKDAKEGLKMYEAMTDKHPQSFELYMGQAEAQRALKESKKAIQLIEEALVLQPMQPDAHRLLEQLKNQHRTVLSLDAFTSKDIGGNDATEGKVYLEMSAGDKHRIYTHYHYRNAMQPGANTQSKQRVFLIGDRWSYGANLTLEASVGKVYGSNTENIFNNTLFNVGGRINLIKYHEFGLKYMREAYNYTVDLINSGIIMNNLSASYAYRSPVGVGTYSHYIKTSQTDDNGRDLWFSSVYYHINNSPQYKIGVNGSSLNYDWQASELYFSPDDLRTGELFFETSNLSTRITPFSYRFLMAVGKQKIEEQQAQNTRRIELQLGYQLMNQLQTEIYIQHNNAAQANAIGFSFTSYGLKCRMLL